MAALGTIEDIARFDRMYQCGKDCCRGVRWKTSIQAFEAELFMRTAQSCRLVESGAWHPQRKPVHFTVMERGKVRPIDAPHVDDRQVQKAHSRFVLAPCYGPAMIYDNGASQQGMGLEFAYRRLKRALMRHYRRYGREGSAILCDLKEVFPSVYAGGAHSGTGGRDGADGAGDRAGPGYAAGHGAEPTGDGGSTVGSG